MALTKHTPTRVETPLAQTPKVAPKAPATKKPAPDWLLKTPMPTHYSLGMYDDDGGNTNDQILTRFEFIELKRKLASMRGYDVPEVIEDLYAVLDPSTGDDIAETEQTAKPNNDRAKYFREYSQGRLESSFEDFVKHGGAEEKFMLQEILGLHGSGYHGSGYNALAGCFDYVTSDAGMELYVKVPEKLVDEVRDLVEQLIAAKD